MFGFGKKKQEKRPKSRKEPFRFSKTSEKIRIEKESEVRIRHFGKNRIMSRLEKRMLDPNFAKPFSRRNGLIK